MNSLKSSVKGGTTEAALKVFNENSLKEIREKEILENGILSAENRAKRIEWLTH